MKLAYYVAFLRALYLLYQNAHWQFQGDYGNHLMFERLYKGVKNDLDEIAEQTIALTDSKVLNLQKQIEFINSILEDINEFENFHQAGLKAEEIFQKLANKIVSESSDEGLKNTIIQHISNSQKERVYLLKQTSQ